MSALQPIQSSSLTAVTSVYSPSCIVPDNVCYKAAVGLVSAWLWAACIKAFFMHLAGVCAGVVGGSVGVLT